MPQLCWDRNRARRFVARMAAGLCLLGLAPVASAGQWFIESAMGQPGATVNASVWFAGEGATSDTQLSIVFDQARLTLPVQSGPIPGAVRVSGAYCNRNASNRITILWVGMGNPLPSGWTQVCQIPYTIPSNAPAGTARLTGVEQECASTSGAQPCVVYHGQVTVQAQGSGGQPFAMQSSSAIALLSAERAVPTAEMLSATDYSRTDQMPLVAALDRVRPSRVRPLMPIRAEGDFRSFLKEHPKTARAILERFIVIDYSTPERARAGLSELRVDRSIEFGDFGP